MKQHRILHRSRLATAGLAALACATLAILPGCEKPAAVALPPPVVQVMDVEPTDLPLSTEIIGQLDSPQNVEIRARVEGFVDAVLFTEGTEVKEGDPLFKLDDSPYQKQLAAAQGALAESQASLNKYQKDVARLTPLAQMNAVSRQDLDNALAYLQIGEANILSAQARVDSAQLDINYCDIHAPISGLIGAKQVSIGDLVGKSEPTLLATISTLDPIWFYCNVSEVEYLKAQEEVRRTGQRVIDRAVSLILSDGSTFPEKGKFVFVDRAVDVRTGTLRLRAEFPNPQRMLRPGLFGRIRVDLGTRPNSIVVPQRAVVELQDKNFVWVVGPDNKVTQRPVTVGEPYGSNILVSDGLQPGDRIVVEGLQKVREGATVNPQQIPTSDTSANAVNSSTP
jgi:membrane fusion protein (multidrug efflux system)